MRQLSGKFLGKKIKGLQLLQPFFLQLPQPENPYLPYSLRPTRDSYLCSRQESFYPIHHGIGSLAPNPYQFFSPMKIIPPEVIYRRINGNVDKL
jgi:hypothetical protein